VPNIKKDWSYTAQEGVGSFRLQCKSFALLNMLLEKKFAAYLKDNRVSLLEPPLTPILVTI
jgi:hypothetical protein